MTGSDKDVEGAGGLVQSVDRALRLVELIAHTGGELSVTQLAREMGIHKSTASRLLATLEAHSLVESDRGHYRLGLGLLGLAGSAAFSLDLVGLAHPTLVALCRVTGETTNLAVPAEDCALYLDQVSPTATVQARSWVGQRIPLHATSNGKVILAFGDPGAAPRLDTHRLRAHTACTITDPGALQRELEQIRTTGWAGAVDEWEEGLTAVAAPIRGLRGELLGSLSVSGPTFRMRERLQQLGSDVMAAAAAVTVPRITTAP